MPKLSHYERFDAVGAKIRRFHKHLLETICARTGKSQRELIESWIEREFAHEPALQRYKHVIDTFRHHIQALEEGQGDNHEAGQGSLQERSPCPPDPPTPPTRTV